MTKKKRELIDILLDNVKPEDWQDDFEFASQDKSTKRIFASKCKPINSTQTNMWVGGVAYKLIFEADEICKHWNKAIVHRDEFMKRWNERNTPVEEKTLTFSREGIDSFTVTEKMEKISIKPDTDSEGWIQWNGGEMPVEEGTIIDVKYRNGATNLHISAGTPLIDNGSITGKYACDWRPSESDWSIVAYRLHAQQQQKTPQQLALEKFGTDWHKNEGAQPVDDEVLVDLIMNSGDEKEEYFANYWSWHADQVLHIKKWRIHSDEKKSSIDDAVKKLIQPESKIDPESEDFKKMNKICMSTYGLKQEFLYGVHAVKSPLETQIVGDHYTKLSIQPMQYSMKNGLDPLQHTIIKYVTRFRDKAGIEDLEKAKHCIDMLIEHERSLM